MRANIRHGAPVLTAAELRAAEQAALPAEPPLMERAGLAAAEIARELAAGGRPILVLAGPGNNGGDAFVVARHLRQWWYRPVVVFAGDESKLSGDASAALHAWRESGGETLSAPPAGRDWGAVIDGMFGIGLQRDVAAPYAEWIDLANRTGAPVLALDAPSGLDSDSGAIRGCAVRATRTVTFIALKPGLVTLDGPDCCGEITVCDLDLPASLLAGVHGRVLGPEILGSVLAPRARNSHKGSYGSTGIIGGDRGMVGAALLAGRAALKLGSGRVYIGLLAYDAFTVDPVQPELMLRTADEVLKLAQLTCLAAGPGLGTLPDAAFYLDWALESPLPVVLDADALNLVAMSEPVARRLAGRTAPTVLTPHPAEAARLLSTTTRKVQADRVTAARELASRFRSCVALKGAGTICATPAGNWHVNISGNPALASAGTGDVLTGMIAGYLAQGVDAHAAMLAAVHLHGAAADSLVRRGVGPVGLAAGELVDEARTLQNGALNGIGNPSAGVETASK